MTKTDPPRAIQVRPTLRALKLLPSDDPAVAAQTNVLERAKRAPDTDTKRAILFSELRLGQLQHPLLDDVRTALEQGGMPDVHASSTKAAKTTKHTVYEARSRTGAAWRGAVVLEGDIMWLVFADRHDPFHRTAADYIKKGSWLPTQLDRELAAQDAERIDLDRWRVEALTKFLDALGKATTEKRPVEFGLADATSGDACTLRVEIEHVEEPAPTPDLAHTTSGMLRIALLIRGADRELVDSILGILAHVRDGAEERDQSYLKGGGLLLLSTVSHARLAQLTAAVNDTTDVAVQAQVLPTPTVLHYVNTGRLAAGLVNGTAVLSLCGEWFVPRLDGSADLPVCRTCEERKPLAQALLDGLRS
jgi:hypothetical protein